MFPTFEKNPGYVTVLLNVFLEEIVDLRNFDDHLEFLSLLLAEKVIL